MTVKILVGDCRDVLRTLPEESVPCCVTSPPYWGLRSYGVPPVVWGGNPECEHEWGDAVLADTRPYGAGLGGWAQDGVEQGRPHVAQSQGNFCRRCGAWRGSLGLEPTIDLFVAHIVEVFKEIKRVLRSDGTCWVNLGDSYSQDTKWGGSSSSKNYISVKGGYQVCRNNRTNSGLKPKDLCMIPARVALALQADGWWLRSDIVWCLSGGTRVYARTQQGDMPLTIKDLVRLRPGTVQLWNGSKWTKVLGWSRASSRVGALEIELRSGERIGCTPEHQWPTQRGLVKTKELRVGDVLNAVQLPEPYPQKDVALVPDHIGWFVGMYLAEGSRDSENIIQIASHAKEIGRFKNLQDIAAAYDATCRIHKTGENGVTVSMARCQLLNGVIDKYVAGRTARDKHLTNACWQRSNSFLLAILQGYLDGDGHWEECSHRWQIGFTRNYYWEADLRTLCARLGFGLRLKMSKAMMNGRAFPSFRGELRMERSNHFNAKRDSEVMSVRPGRGRIFWDVGVEDEPHTFALSSGVSTHNSKPNVTPESCTDRPTKCHEYVFLLAKSGHYFYDQDAVREPQTGNAHSRGKGITPKTVPVGYSRMIKANASFHQNCSASTEVPGGRNRRSVWTIPAAKFKGSHFATFAPALAEICIAAGTSERGACPMCGAPWERIVEPTPEYAEHLGKDWADYEQDDAEGRGHFEMAGGGKACQRPTKRNAPRLTAAYLTMGWRPTCECYDGHYRSLPRTRSTEKRRRQDMANSWWPRAKRQPGKDDWPTVPCVVLDPFGGAGTTGLQADRMKRDAVLIELNPDYARMAEERIREDGGWFTQVESQAGAPPGRQLVMELGT